MFDEYQPHIKFKNLRNKDVSAIELCLSRNFLAFGDILALLADWNEKHQDEIKEQKHEQGLMATEGLISLLGNKEITPLNVTYLIDAIKFRYPNGYDSAACDMDKEILNKFVVAAKAKGFTPEDSFIKDIREFSDLLRKLYEQYEEE